MAGSTGRPRSVSTKASADTANTVASAMLINTPQPKYQTSASVPGTNARQTCSMTQSTRLIRALWGEETNNPVDINPDPR